MNINFARYTLYSRHMDISFPKLCESCVHLSTLSVDTKQTASYVRVHGTDCLEHAGYIP